jgi:transcriptional regulator with XRE-family HTH domain
MSTGNRVQARRESLNMSRAQLAAKLGTTRMTVWRVETGKQHLRTDDLPAWASALQTTGADLVPEPTELVA